MAASIKYFYPKLVEVPEVVILVEHYFGDKAHHVLDCMKTSEGLGTAEADNDLEQLLQTFVTDHALEVTSFQALGQSDATFEILKATPVMACTEEGERA